MKPVSIDTESDAMALIHKFRGQDESMVTQRHFADTINASINFKGEKEFLYLSNLCRLQA